MRTPLGLTGRLCRGAGGTQFPTQKQDHRWGNQGAVSSIIGPTVRKNLYSSVDSGRCHPFLNLAEKNPCKDAACKYRQIQDCPRWSRVAAFLWSNRRTEMTRTKCSVAVAAFLAVAFLCSVLIAADSSASPQNSSGAVLLRGPGGGGGGGGGRPEGPPPPPKSGGKERPKPPTRDPNCPPPPRPGDPNCPPPPPPPPAGSH